MCSHGGGGGFVKKGTMGLFQLFAQRVLDTPSSPQKLLSTPHPSGKTETGNGAENTDIHQSSSRGGGLDP